MIGMKKRDQNKVVIVLPPNTCAEGVSRYIKNGSFYRLKLNHYPNSNSQNVHRGFYVATQRMDELRKAVGKMPEADIYIWLSSLGGGRGGGAAVKFLELMNETLPSRSIIFAYFVLPEQFTVRNPSKFNATVQTTVNTTVSLSRLHDINGGKLAMNFVSNKTLRKICRGEGIKGYELIDRLLADLLLATKEAAETRVNLDEFVKRGGRFGTIGIATKPLLGPVYREDLPPKEEEVIRKCEPWISSSDVPVEALDTQFVAIGLPRKILEQLERKPLSGEADFNVPEDEADNVPVVYEITNGMKPEGEASDQRSGGSYLEEVEFPTTRKDIIGITRYTLGDAAMTQYLQACNELEQKWRTQVDPDDPYTKMYHQLYERRYGL